MGDVARKLEGRFTWADYRTWPDDERWEIIGGEAYAMSPSPTVRHQRIQLDLAVALMPHFRKKPCQVFVAPLDVKLSDEDVVQPDILIVCAPSQLTRTHVEGAPTLVVEIVSDHSAAHDRVRKCRLYARAGVREYWIVTPHPSMVEVLSLDGTSYRLAGSYEKKDMLKSPAFPELALKLDEVFTFTLEPGEEPPALREPPGPYRAAVPKS
jgi:Uma2 family endonuclease